MRLRAVGISEGNALRDQAARARCLRCGNQIGRAFDTQAGIARERIAKAGRIKDLRQIGQLMDDRFRVGCDHSIAQGPGIEDVNHDRFDAVRFELSDFAGRARRSGHLVPGSKQKRHQPPSDRSARSGQENPHVDQQSMIGNDEFASSIGRKCTCGLAVCQLELGDDRIVVPAQIGALAVRRKAKAHRSFSRRERRDRL